MNLIGVSGKRGTGKTTLVNHLEFFLGDYYCKHLNFGDLLKQEVAEKFNFDLTMCYSEKGKEEIIHVPWGVAFEGASFDCPKAKMTVRELLQWYGTDVVRRSDPDHWVNIMLDLIAGYRCSDNVLNILIGDVRFPNEVDMINLYEGRAIRLLPYQDYDVVDEHESETALDNYPLSNYWLTIAPPYKTLKQTAQYIRGLII